MLRQGSVLLQAGTPMIIPLALQSLEILLHPIETDNTELKPFRQLTEQTCLSPILELVEIGYNAIRLFARLDIIHDGIKPERSTRQAGNILGKQSAQEERVVADVLSNLPFAVKRGGFEQWI
jgi:hypothetical protein